MNDSLPGNFRRAFWLLCWEAAFAMAYENWVGATYLSGLAGELGVSVAVVTFLTALPWIGSLGQAAGLLAFERTGSLKRYTVFVAGLARSLWLLPLGMAIVFGAMMRLDPERTFPREAWVLLLAVTASFTALLASSSAVAWMSWIRTVIRPGIRGRFFGLRTRFTMVAVIVSNLIGAAVVGWKPDGYFAGYAILGTLALTSAAISTWLLAKVPDVAEVRGEGTPVRERAPIRVDTPMGAWLAFGREIPGKLRRWRGPVTRPEFLRVLMFGALFNGVVLVAGPFFPYYFTGTLKIPMNLVASWAIFSNLGCLIASGLWGRAIDRSGNPGPVLWVCAGAIVVSPLFYLSSDPGLIRMIAPVEYFINGTAWAGYQIAISTLLFRSSSDENSAIEFSAYTAASGLMGAAFTLIGGNLASLLESYGGFRALWWIAAGLRGAAVIGGFLMLRRYRGFSWDGGVSAAK